VERGVLVNIDIVHKVLRTQSVLSIFNETRDRARGDPHEALNKLFIGATVMTTYNKRTYKVDSIDFNKSPKDTFEVTEKGGETRTVSYEDYFRTKYDARITDSNQPVLVSVDKRTS
jgi:aubergine-like protein